jgi:hypothetical protein
VIKRIFKRAEGSKSGRGTGPWRKGTCALRSVSGAEISGRGLVIDRRRKPILSGMLEGSFSIHRLSV